MVELPRERREDATDPYHAADKKGRANDRGRDPDGGSEPRNVVRPHWARDPGHDDREHEHDLDDSPPLAARTERWDPHPDYPIDASNSSRSPGINMYLRRVADRLRGGPTLRAVLVGMLREGDEKAEFLRGSFSDVG